MNLTLTIIISLVASVIGGVISGLFVMRKFTYDAKRLYARQMYDDFNVMSTLTFANARDYLESLGYEVTGIEAYKPSTNLKENLAVVNRVRSEHRKFDYRRLEAYETQKLVAQLDDLEKYTIDETPGFKKFLNIYLLQSTYFDGLCEASSAVELLKFWQNQIPKSVNDTQIRICVSNVTAYLLQMLNALLKAGAEIDYYSNAKSWTWRLFIPTRQKGRVVMNNENKDTKVKGRWWSGLWSQLLVGLSQIFFAVVLSGMVLYLLAKYKLVDLQSFELATVAALLGGFPLVAAFVGNGVDEIIRKRLKIIGGLYLFAAICFVVFGFYQTADLAHITPSSRTGLWMFNIIYVTTFYGGAIALIFGMWMSLEIIPRLIGLGGVRDRVRIIFEKIKRVKRG